MASPRRIFSIYQRLHADAQEIRDFQVAKGEKVSGTVTMLLKGDAAKLLTRFGEEMHEIAGVLDGTHDDPYILESTQTFYWASLFAAVKGVTWDDIDFEAQRDAAAKARIEDGNGLLDAVDRLVALGEDGNPAKCFLLWWVADNMYRAQTPPEDQWSVETIMEADLSEMKTRSYLKPILDAVPE